jgi:hypothetical protein
MPGAVRLSSLVIRITGTFFVFFALLFFFIGLIMHKNSTYFSYAQDGAPQMMNKNLAKNTLKTKIFSILPQIH